MVPFSLKVCEQGIAHLDNYTCIKLNSHSDSKAFGYKAIALQNSNCGVQGESLQHCIRPLRAECLSYIEGSVLNTFHVRKLLSSEV